MNKKRIIVIIFILFASLFSFKVINPIIIEKNYKSDISEEVEETKIDITENMEEQIRKVQVPDVIQKPTVVKKKIRKPIIYVNPKSLKILEGTKYDVYKGVTVANNTNNNLSATITDTTILEGNKIHTITYFAKNSAGIASNERFIEVLLPKDDEDNDKFTNKEEVDNNTDFNNEEDYPFLMQPEFGKFDQKILLLQYDNYIDIKPKAYDTIAKELDVISTNPEIDTSIIGTNFITYETIDRVGNRAEVTRIIEVLDHNEDYDNDKFTNKEEFDNNTDYNNENDYPILNIPIFEDFDSYLIVNKFEQYIDIKPKAFDTLLKELDVISTNSEIDTSITGNNLITYEATDRLENRVKATRIIEVLDFNADYDNDKFTNKEEIDNNTDYNNENDYPILCTPVFEEFVSYIEIKQFKEYNDIIPKAYDKIGKELIVSVSGYVDTNILNEYELKYTAIDRKGNEITVNRRIKIIEEQF
ncbi:MAG: DUF5011 domain-containing protein [Bacilli bacterium]|nr:DUF5011 domain-containing protein [Bacilli bacterium]